MASVSLTLGSNEYPLTVVDGTALTLSLSGPAGPAGPAGPNTVSTSTTTNLTGYIYGNGTTVGGATAATSAATANTLVLRDASGGVAVSTINNLAITAAANSILTIDEDKGITLFDSITTEFGGYINTDAGGYIVTGVNGNITTGAGGYIQTGIGGHISTAAGGSFATGTGNLTGPNASGTVALINPSSGTQTFSEAQNFSGQVELTGQAATNPTSAMTRALVDERVMPQAHLPSRFVVTESDFINSALNTLAFGVGFSAIGASGGTGSTGSASTQISSNHPGVYQFANSTAANSGYGLTTGSNLPILLGGGEEYTLIFKPVLNANTTRCRIGFAASMNNAAPNYIAYAEGVGDGAGNVVFSAITANFSGGILNTTTNATTYSAALDVWYQMRVVVNASAASVSFYLYSESGTLLWSVTNSTNIPTFTVQCGCLFYNTTAIAATVIAYVDYHKFEINRTLIR